MKRREILGEHKKGTKAVKYNKKPANPSVAHAKAKEKLAPVKPLEEGIDEMRDRRDAYQRDYDSSVSGMGKRDSLAYQLDGGANDEGWDEEPRRSYSKPQQSKGMYFYNVPPEKEQDARLYGLRQTKSGKWFSKTQSSTLEKVFGRGRYWEPKNEATGAEVGKISKVDPATKKATLTKPDGSSMEVDSTALKPTPDGRMQMDTPDATELKAGTSVVSTESADLTAMLRIAGLR